MFKIPEGSSYPPHLDRDCPQSPCGTSSWQIFDHTHDFVDKSMHPAFRVAHTFPRNVNLALSASFANQMFLTAKMSDTREFSPAKRAIFEHMKLLHKKPTPDLFEWGKHLSKLWVSVVFIDPTYFANYSCVGVRKKPALGLKIWTTITSTGSWTHAANFIMCTIRLYCPRVVNSSPQICLRNTRDRFLKQKVRCLEFPKKFPKKC